MVPSSIPARAWIAEPSRPGYPGLTNDQTTALPLPRDVRMRELLQILTEGLRRSEEWILCQVVETRGSTPQKAGAIMIVASDGSQAGTLGGGCVEAEVKQTALRNAGRLGSQLHNFILDHDYAWADGLICGGKMVIAAETLNGIAALRYYEAYARLLEAGEGFTEAVVVDPIKAHRPELAIASRFLFGPSGQIVASWPEGLAAGDIEATPLAERPRPAVTAGIAFLPTLPRVRLVIVGAGHVGQAVAALASQADFDVWMVDDRQEYANSERIPSAQRHLVGPIEEILANLDITEHTYALIVTRGHGHDQEALFHLAPTIAPYVGLIGSRRKIRLIMESLLDAGISEESVQRVTAPVGFDIGSQTVPEIAISIVAELIARRNLGEAGMAAKPRIHASRTNSLSESSPS